MLYVHGIGLKRCVCVCVCVCVCAANKLRDELFSNCGASEADWRVPRKSSRSNGALVCHRVDARRCVCCMDCLRCTQPKQFCWAVSHTGLSLSYLLTYVHSHMYGLQSFVMEATQCIQQHVHPTQTQPCNFACFDLKQYSKIFTTRSVAQPLR